MKTASKTETEKFDLDFRPHSYWGPQDLNTYYGARAKGEQRRQAGQDLLDGGNADQGILGSSLSEEERKAVGEIHPWLMGGEYLPDFEPDEVEIARVVMKSTTMDVISIRARPTKRRIIFRIVDEYADEWSEDDEWGHYRMVPKSSARPLTLKKLIRAIEVNELIDGPRRMNYEGGCSAEEIYNFATASSAYYLDLASWFDKANEKWLRNKLESQRHEE